MQTIGYTGGKNIKDIQDFLAKNYTGLVQDYMAFRGIPDTNKGKQLRKEGYYTPVDAFTDGLWWYRSLLPYTKYFKTEEEKNTFIKDMVAVKNGDVTYYTDNSDSSPQRLYINTVVGEEPKDYVDPSSFVAHGNKVGTSEKLTETSVSDIGKVPPAHPVFPETPLPSGNMVYNEIKDPVPDIDVKLPERGYVAENRFNEPLRWYDVAPDIYGFLNALDREENKLRVLKRDPLQYVDTNIEPFLNEGLSNFNAVASMLPNNAVGYANYANLLNNRLEANRKIFGAISEQDKKGRLNIDQYNDTTQYALQKENMALEDAFINKNLAAKEAQRQQLMAYFNSIMNKIAQNRKLNREGNLILKLSPHFDQFGNFNGTTESLSASVDNLNNVTAKDNLESTITYDKDGNAMIVTKNTVTGKTLRTQTIPKERIKK